MRIRDIGSYWLIFVGTLIVLVAVWSGYWFLAREATDNRYEINQNSQAWQAAKTKELRNTVSGYYIAVDEGQKANFKNTFCTTYGNLTQPANDLTTAYNEICEGNE